MNIVVSSEEYIAQFEAGEIAPENFHHCDHVRLAFAYLRSWPVLTALERFSSALKNFAAAAGKADRYNETTTFAYFFLIHERMERQRSKEWDAFVESNADLFSSPTCVLNRYYQESTLKSDLARRVFVLPDKF